MVKTSPYRIGHESTNGSTNFVVVQVCVQGTQEEEEEPRWNRNLKNGR